MRLAFMGLTRDARCQTGDVTDDCYESGVNVQGRDIGKTVQNASCPPRTFPARFGQQAKKWVRKPRSGYCEKRTFGESLRWIPAIMSRLVPVPNNGVFRSRKLRRFTPKIQKVALRVIRPVPVGLAAGLVKAPPAFVPLGLSLNAAGSHTGSHFSKLFRAPRHTQAIHNGISNAFCSRLSAANEAPRQPSLRHSANPKAPIPWTLRHILCIPPRSMFFRFVVTLKELSHEYSSSDGSIWARRHRCPRACRR